MMIPIKFTLSVLLYILLLPVSTPAAFVVSTWTRPDDTDWGGWFGTYDNPPQGARKWLKDHPELTGWRGYLNRVGWIRRNRLYGPVSYTHLRAHETGRNLVCRLLLEKKKNT